MRVLSGIQPTGRFHWGNYFGAIRQYIDLQDNDQAFYFIADLHALTTVHDADTMRQNTLDAALDLLALGLDPERATLFRQSDVPQVTDLTWILLTQTQMHLLEKCHAYKEKRDRGVAADAGLFTYPVLMAADILLYDSDVVPVGVDQVQHIEVTRDIAQRLNSRFGEGTLHLPNARVLDATAKVPGLDGQKMSKSYGNTLEIFEPEKKLRKKINKITTDSTPMEEAKDPETCNVFTLYKLFADDEKQQALAARYAASGEDGMGYGEAKKALANAALDYFAEARAKRADLENRLSDVEAILQDGASRAREVGQEVLARVMSATGLRRA